ncbi:HNH endonuclease signature motif containing protein [Galbibacter sp. EGI 63066]|uniref:HNH endonuclease n=1 Tax=Galbibacter sp. EGI 63066 TaxID=2993559 RepID=UPI002248BB0B|nr:HNH endonuclease signature motif containing protein [Galbibacter sp. EGI 63066]MCX2678826.1 HNH endonuclease signature motif containing protein [Galbibacter sp. EGI 63066]
MCRGKNICSELGTNPNNWDVHSPLPTPNWMAEQIDIFESAANDFIAGNRNSCINRITQIRSDEITQWYIEHGQMSGRHRKLVLKAPPPANIDEELRDPIRSPKKVQNEVFERDGYRCRYCGNKLISQDFIRLFIKKLDSDVFKKGNTNLTKHGIIHLTWPVADHVKPWKQGGRTDLTNLVSSCATCNYGKDGCTIEQLGIEDPFNRPPIINDWKGLTDKITKLRKIK